MILIPKKQEILLINSKDKLSSLIESIPKDIIKLLPRLDILALLTFLETKN